MIKLKSLIRESKLITEATRWAVGVEMPNGKITSVYGHYDGYPEYVGKLLKKYYSQGAGKVRDLVKLGKQGISTLGKNLGKKHDFNMPYDEKEKLGYTTFYGRDRGEKGNMTSKYKNMEEFGKKFTKSGGAEFGYIWSVNDRKWYVFDYYGKKKEL
tara:strand:- start:981 stop:1448 length:468 start_codon:yes stop_codon:yes gene_type:complete